VRRDPDDGLFNRESASARNLKVMRSIVPAHSSAGMTELFEHPALYTSAS
jgi:hypothetical protein